MKWVRILVRSEFTSDDRSFGRSKVLANSKVEALPHVILIGLEKIFLVLRH